jgi:hypothetical protein
VVEAVSAAGQAEQSETEMQESQTEAEVAWKKEFERKESEKSQNGRRSQ